MKLSDYIAQFLADQEIRHVFAIAGGASLHLIQSLEDVEGTQFVPTHHEQAAAMAADAYARVTGGLGAAISTSGPGATNMMTGVCCSYFDSVPTIFITGQVATFRLKRDSGVRQLGFQETDTVEIYKPVTKYAHLVDVPDRIKYELEKAVYIAKSGRPGPVLLDIPDDVFRSQVDPEKMESFTPPARKPVDASIEQAVDQAIQLAASAKRPMLVIGWGVRLAGAEIEALKFVERLGFPVAPTWAARDLFPAAHPLLAGSFGTHGTRAANFAVQNADLLISVGARLDSREAGTPPTTFARGAKKVVVDIDPGELGKFYLSEIEVAVPVRADALDFFHTFESRSEDLVTNDISDWIDQVDMWKSRFPVCAPEYHGETELNPYVFVKALSDEMANSAVMFVDTGCAIAWMMQGFEFKSGQRLFHDFNNTAMGYALPASVGASLALGNGEVVCVAGDGSMQMNIQELATVISLNLPIKIFLINNQGYSMIRQTQDQWLDSRYLASSAEGGLGFPDWERVPEGYGFKTATIKDNQNVAAQVRRVLDTPGPVFCNVEIRPDHGVIPQVAFGRPIEDSEPLLPRETFFANMIIPPMEISETI